VLHQLCEQRCDFAETRAHEGTVAAVPSGNRSAVVPMGTWNLRLKGCGDGRPSDWPFPPFPALRLARRDGFEVLWRLRHAVISSVCMVHMWAATGLCSVSQVRGCCFRHTALREAFITQLLIDHVAKSDIGLDGRYAMGNTPIGMSGCARKIAQRVTRHQCRRGGRMVPL
jgi:hypothetical protein